MHGAFPGHTVGQWSLTRLLPSQSLCYAATSDPHSAPLHCQNFASQIPDLQGALCLGVLGRANLLEPLSKPLSWTPPSQPPKVFAPACTIQARTLNWGTGQGCLAGFRRTLFPLVINMGFPDNVGGSGSDVAGVPMAMGQTWTPIAVTKEISPAVSMSS